MPAVNGHRVPWSKSSTTATDISLHQLAPYIGRMKTSMARALISARTVKGDLIVDPFCGCGVVALEAAAMQRRVVVGDWNPYAVLLTRAKLFPPKSINAAQRRRGSLVRIQSPRPLSESWGSSGVPPIALSWASPCTPSSRPPKVGFKRSKAGRHAPHRKGFPARRSGDALNQLPRRRHQKPDVNWIRT